MMGARREIIQSARPPSYVSRETGAAELDVSPDTWDAMNKAGRLPKPILIGSNGTTPRWRWADVDAMLSGKKADEGEQPEPERFFRSDRDGQTKDGRRAAS